MASTFIFHNDFSLQSLNDLYDSDYLMIEEVFTSVLEELGPLTDNVLACFTAGDLAGLKGAVHKIKPLFGFTGLLSIESLCLQFENSCQQSASTDQLATEFSGLYAALQQGRTILAAEKERLILFNHP